MPRLSGGRSLELAWPIVVFAPLGALAGLLWWAIATPPYFVRNQAGYAMGQQQLSTYVDQDMQLIVIGFVAGLVVGAALLWWRERDAVLTVLGGVVGSLVAGWLTVRVGEALGHVDVRATARATAVGGHVRDSLTAYSHLTLSLGSARMVVYYGVLAWALGFLLGALAVLWGISGRHGGGSAQDVAARPGASPGEAPTSLAERS